LLSKFAPLLGYLLVGLLDFLIGRGLRQLFSFLGFTAIFVGL
jgi:hypothetical protein